MVDVRRFKKAGMGGFADDIAKEGKAAHLAGRPADREQIRSLWIDFLQTELPALGDAKLNDYLETRTVWRDEGDWTVYRTEGEPCIAFTALVQANGSVELIALAAIDRFPGGSEQQWWQSVVLPRVRQL